MLKNVAKKPPKTKDPELSRILSAIYDDINQLTDHIAPVFDSQKPAKQGDIKVVDSIFYYHTGNDWQAIDVAKLNRALFGGGGDGGENDNNLTPLQNQITDNAGNITNNLYQSKFFFFWGSN